MQKCLKKVKTKFEMYATGTYSYEIKVVFYCR